MHQEAKRIFFVYLENDGMRQICLESIEMKTVTDLVNEKKVDRALFRSAQRSVFRDLESGVFPGFLAALNKRGLAALNDALAGAPANAPALATANALSKRAEESQ